MTNSDSKLGEVKLPPGSPWDWVNLTDSQILDLAALSEGTDPSLPLFQYSAVQRCYKLKAGVEAGNGFDILACVRTCGTHGLVMPLWLVYAFNRKYDAVLNLNAMSWSDPLSFGKPYPKGSTQAAMRKRRCKAIAVWNEVVVRVKNGEKIDAGLFESVGKPLALGKTLTEEYYYYAMRNYGFFNPVETRDKHTQSVAELHAALTMAEAQGKDKLDVGNGLHLDIPSIPQSRDFSENRGNTNGTLNSPIEPLQPKGQLNDIPRAKSKPNRKTAKASRS
jgi:hypothetical protein